MINTSINYIPQTKKEGFYYDIQTKINDTYEIKFDLELMKGKKCYFVIQNNKDNKHNKDKKNLWYVNDNAKIIKINDRINKKYIIIGTGKNIKIGIMFKKKYIEYELHIFQFEIVNNGNIMNNMDNITLSKEINLKCIQKNHNYDLFNKYDIFQVYISNSLKHFNRIMNIYNLKLYDNKKKPLLVFGLYDNTDLNIVKNHKSDIYILWGGSDADDRIPLSKNILEKVKLLNNVKHFSISNNLCDRLNNFGFKNEKINFNLADPQLFKPSESIGNSIYVYNGFNKKKEWIYGKEIYEEIMNRLPEFKYILSSDLNVSHNDMPNIYSKCFIGLRLTQNDGNANTAQEMELMNIPLIHNGECKNCIKWKNIDDVELAIRYRNIELFNNSIKNYKNILFICNDYPSYGGAATNTYNLINWYEKNGHNVFGIFTHYEKNKEVTWTNTSNNIMICKSLHETKKSISVCQKYFAGNPDLIIFRSYNNYNLFNILNVPKYMLVPGIFLNELDKPYENINDDELDKYVNKKTIEMCRNVDKIFCASHHTIKLLKKYYNLESLPLYFNYIPFYQEKILVDPNFDSRKYEFGIIQSNFNRKIKNIDEAIEILKQYVKFKNIILIGDGSDKYEKYGFKCKKLMDNTNVIKYMKKIKYIVQNSYYESYSNVIMEAKYNGCKTITNIAKFNFVELREKINTQLSLANNIKLLVSSTQYPGYGGAATNAYKLIIYFRKMGFKCAGLYINNNNQDINYDPENIGNIYHLQTDYNFNNIKNNEQIKYKIINYLEGLPDICFGKNYVAPYANKILFQHSFNIYLVSGLSCPILNEKSIEEHIENANNNIFPAMTLEKRTLEVCDHVVCNSKLLYNIFSTIYHKYNTKIYNNIIDTSKYDSHVNNDNNVVKEYDIILVCSSFNRKEKNFDVIADMLKDNLFDNYTKCIVGNNNHIFNDITNKTVFDLQTNLETKKLIAKSKLMIIPSLFEANSNAMREALYNKCLVLINKNVGWNECFPSEFVCNTYEVSEWKNKTLNILKNYDSYKNTKIKFKSDIELNNYALNIINNANINKQNIIDISIMYPKVSIIMTVYNKDKYVDMSIKSIINQSYTNYELIIIEDCSTDNSKNIINKYINHPKIKIFYNEKNIGCYACRNIAIEKSTGDIIAFQDADDYSMKCRIEKQVLFMLQHKLLLCGCNIIRSNIENLLFDNEDDLLLQLHNDNGKKYFGFVTLMIYKSVFDRNGKYIERRKGMDMEYGERILFNECHIKFNKEDSWSFFNRNKNDVYMKINEILYICPKMNNLNVTIYEPDDQYLKKRLWRDSYITH